MPRSGIGLRAPQEPFRRLPAEANPGLRRVHLLLARAGELEERWFAPGGEERESKTARSVLRSVPGMCAELAN